MSSFDVGGDFPRNYWWHLGAGEKHDPIWAAASYLDDINNAENMARIHMLRLYSNRAVVGLNAADFISAMDGGDKIRMNVVRSCIDAATAFNATNRPKPVYMPVGGNYAVKRRAEKQGLFVTGVFHANRQYVQGLDIFRDGAIYGSGWQNIYSEEGCIKIERVMDDEIVLDPNEVRYGDPRTMYRIKDVDREMLKELYPDKAMEIDQAAVLREEPSEMLGISNPCTLVESWHLPSGPNADDGCHVVSVSTATLGEEGWDRPRFPIAKWDWNPSPVGYRGVGIAEELAPIQIEINYIAQKIQRLMTLATSMVWAEKGSGVQELSNKDWAVREFRGKPPVFQNTASISGEYFTHLDRLYQRAFEIVGISQLQAQAKKPAGLDSGEALRAYNDIGSQRFHHTGQRWEDYHVVQVAERILDEARAIQNEGGNVKVLAQGDKGIEEIDFASAGLEEDKYILRVAPASILPDTPAGKIQTFQDIARIDPSIAPYTIEMMDGIPELDGVLKRMKAPMDLVEKMVGAILEDEEYEAPYPEMNLQMARDIGTKELLRAKIDGVPDGRIELLRRWLGDVDSMQAKAEQDMMAQQAAAAGAPTPGAPMAGAPAMPPAPPNITNTQVMNAQAGKPPGAI